MFEFGKTVFDSSVAFSNRNGLCNVQKCHVKKKDIRKFLDGIYVSDRSKIVEEE